MTVFPTPPRIRVCNDKNEKKIEKHEVILTVIYYSEVKNGNKAHEELDELLLSKGYKLINFEHR